MERNFPAYGKDGQIAFRSSFRFAELELVRKKTTTYVRKTSLANLVFYPADKVDEYLSH
jgi:hypothetical protein